LKKLSLKFKESTLSNEEVLFQEGENDKKLFYIVKGHINLYKEKKKYNIKKKESNFNRTIIIAKKESKFFKILFIFTFYFQLFPCMLFFFPPSPHIKKI
jgi:CRP-like cAMP-binding protein